MSRPFFCGLRKAFNGREHAANRKNECNPHDQLFYCASKARKLFSFIIYLFFDTLLAIG